MTYDDRCEYQSEHDDGLAEQELEHSESPVCAKGHAADQVEMCGSCEKYFCSKHIISTCRECHTRACAECVPMAFEWVRDVCNSCIEIAWQEGEPRGSGGRTLHNHGALSKLRRRGRIL